MQVKSKPCGEYQTNCYIISEEIVIDPGVGAYEWIMSQNITPKVILLTHAHFDHAWSVKALQDRFDLKVYIHKDDEFMLTNDIFARGMPPAKADKLISKDCELDILGKKVMFRHFGGHTPGSMTIEIGEYMFSGDFVFEGSIGRCDFPYSDKLQMKKSLKRFLSLNYDKIIYAGHGNKTTIKEEQKNIQNYWLKVL